MTSTAWPVLAGLIGTLAGVVATIVMAQRKASGRINTTEAATLWGASENIRHDLTAELQAQRAENDRLRERVRALETENDRLRELRSS